MFENNHNKVQQEIGLTGFSLALGKIFKTLQKPVKNVVANTSLDVATRKIRSYIEQNLDKILTESRNGRFRSTSCHLEMLMISYMLTELVKVVNAEADHLIYSEKINILEMFANGFMDKLGIDNSDIDVIVNVKIFMFSLMRDARLNVRYIIHENIKKLSSLSNKPLSKKDLLIARILANDPELTHLDLSHGAIFERYSHYDIIEILHAVKHNVIISSISFWHSNLGDDGAVVLAEVLTKNIRINDLNLCCAELSNKGLGYILASQKINPKLTSINVHGNRIIWTPEIIAMFSNCALLDEVDLSLYGRIPVDALDSIASLLKSGTWLPKIHLPCDDADYALYIDSILHGTPIEHPRKSMSNSYKY